MRFMNIATLALVIVGAVNWGLMGFFQFDLVATLFGGPRSRASSMAWSVSRGCTSWSRSLLLSLAQPKTRNSRRALVTRAIRGGLRSAGPPARHLEQTMPRYFFNIRSGTEYLADEDGDECPSLQAAGKRAVVGAKELIAAPFYSTPA